MLFGRAFERALGAYFRRDDPGAVLFAEWSACHSQGLQYSDRDLWDRMLQQGIMLLERFSQEDRVRIREPHQNLQIKFTRRFGEKNDFVAHVDTIGELDGTPLFSRVENYFDPIPRRTRGTAGLGSSTCLLLLDDWHNGLAPTGK